MELQTNKCHCFKNIVVKKYSLSIVSFDKGPKRVNCLERSCYHHNYIELLY